MNALDRKPPGPVITVHCRLPVLCLAVFCSRCGRAVRGNDFKLETTSCTSGCGSAPQTGHSWEWESPISSPLPCAGQRGRRAAQGQAEGAWGVRGRVLTLPTQLAAPWGKSACQPLLRCLLKSKYPRDSWMSIICTVFIQRDFVTMQGNSYLIHLQPSDLILLIKRYC